MTRTLTPLTAEEVARIPAVCQRLYFASNEPGALDAADLIERIPATLDAARARSAALHTELRNLAIHSNNGHMTCLACLGGWELGDFERHAPGCLAAPDEEARDAARE